jgi:hypothetical protein
MTYLNELNRTRQLAGMQPLSEDQTMKISEIINEGASLPPKMLADARAQGKEIGTKSSQIIWEQEYLAKIVKQLSTLAHDEKVKGTKRTMTGTLAEKEPRASEVLPPNLAKSFAALIDLAEDIEMANEYLKSVWKASI